MLATTVAPLISPVPVPPLRWNSPEPMTRIGPLQDALTSKSRTPVTKSRPLPLYPAPTLRFPSTKVIEEAVVTGAAPPLQPAELPVEQIQCVVDVWVEQCLELGALPYVHHVQVFENKGEMMGASNPHPHGQIWANETLPTEPRKEDTAQRDYLHESGRCLLCDYLKLESSDGERSVVENEAFLCVVPFWAIYFDGRAVDRRWC